MYTTVKPANATLSVCLSVCLSVSLSLSLSLSCVFVCVCVCVCVCACMHVGGRAGGRACVHYSSYVFLLNWFSYNCNLFKHFSLFFCFPDQFRSSTCYTDGMFQSKFSFKDNKVLSYLTSLQSPTLVSASLSTCSTQTVIRLSTSESSSW